MQVFGTSFGQRIKNLASFSLAVTTLVLTASILWTRHTRFQETRVLVQACRSPLAFQLSSALTEDAVRVATQICQCSVSATLDFRGTEVFEASLGNEKNTSKETLLEVIQSPARQNSPLVNEFLKQQDSCLLKFAPGQAAITYANYLGVFAEAKAEVLTERNRLIRALPINSTQKTSFSVCLVNEVAKSCPDKSFFGLRGCTERKLDQPFWEQTELIDDCTARIANSESKEPLVRFWKEEVTKAFEFRLREAYQASADYSGTQFRFASCVAKEAIDHCAQTTVGGMWRCADPENNPEGLKTAELLCKSSDTESQEIISHTLEILK